MVGIIRYIILFQNCQNIGFLVDYFAAYLYIRQYFIISVLL